MSTLKCRERLHQCAPDRDAVLRRAESRGGEAREDRPPKEEHVVQLGEAGTLPRRLADLFPLSSTLLVPKSLLLEFPEIAVLDGPGIAARRSGIP